MSICENTQHDWKYNGHEYGRNFWKCNECSVIISRVKVWRPLKPKPTDSEQKELELDYE